MSKPGTERGHLRADGRWESDGIVGGDGMTLDRSTAGDLNCDGCDRMYRPEPLGDRGLCCICEQGVVGP